MPRVLSEESLTASGPQLSRIQIQKGGKVLLWNQVKSWMDAILNLFYLCLIPAAQPRVLSEESLTASGPQLSRIQIQKGGKVLLWNQVKSWMDAILNLFYLCLIPAAQPRVLSEESLTASGPPPFEEGWCCFLFFGKVCVPISAKVLPPTWFGQGWCWLTLGRGSGESTV